MAQLINYNRDEYQRLYDAANAGIRYGRLYGPKIKAAYSSLMNAADEFGKYQASRSQSKNNTTKSTMSMRRNVSSGVLGQTRITRRGLTVGKYKRPSFRQRLQNAMHPVQKFDSKWTFQMDCASGRMSAVTIPVLTKDLVAPIYTQLFYSAVSDTTVMNPNMNDAPGLTTQYRIAISSYISLLKFYNSSTITAQCRLVWYRPKRDSGSQIVYPSAYINNTPLALTMYASLQNQPSIPSVTSAVGDGLSFDYSTPGSDINGSYDHAGWPITGSTTTTSSTQNFVAQLDPTLSPGSPQVRSMVSKHWTAVKSVDFTMIPGSQFETSLRIKNKFIKRGDDDLNTKYFRSGSFVGVLYVIGQTVFSDTTSEVTPAADSSTITTGSCQISCMREDICSMRPDVTKRTSRINLTQPFQQLVTSKQALVNELTGKIDNTHDMDR